MTTPPGPAACAPACRWSRRSIRSRRGWPRCRSSMSAAVAPPPGADESARLIRTWVAVIGAAIGAFMAVLNILIVNASLSDIQGAIGAGVDDGAWVSTAYLVAEIIVIPLTRFLAQVFSMRRYLLVNAV